MVGDDEHIRWGVVRDGMAEVEGGKETVNGKRRVADSSRMRQAHHDEEFPEMRRR